MRFFFLHFRLSRVYKLHFRLKKGIALSMGAYEMGVEWNQRETW